MIEFLKSGFLLNQWLWFHALGAMVLLKLFHVRIVLAIAIVWELIELYLSGWQVYGTTFHFWADSFGDIIIVPVVWLIIIWDGKWPWE